MGILSTLGCTFLFYILVMGCGHMLPVIGPELSRYFENWQMCYSKDFHLDIPDCSKSYMSECITKITKRTKHQDGGWKEEPVWEGCPTLKSITIPGSVEVIPRDSFSNAMNLEAVHIGQGVKEIGWGAFANAYSLKDINIPPSVEKIHSSSFHGVGEKTNGRVHQYDKDALGEKMVEPKVDNPITEIKFRNRPSLDLTK